MKGEEEFHFPVLLDRILEYTSNLENVKSPVIVDGTLGAGGHTISFHKNFPDSIIYSFDRDPEMVKLAADRMTSEGIRFSRADCPDKKDAAGIHLLNFPFSRGPSLLASSEIFPDFILLDLGVSIHHFRSAKRGFSYTDGTLDMRLSPDLPNTASELLETLPETELADLFRELGEERFSGRIARAVKENLPLKSAEELARVVMKAVPSIKESRGSGKKIHPATRIFQALRIYVNDELKELEAALNAFPEFLSPGGRMAIITFHSLEDRMVKNAFKKIGGKIVKNRSAKREKYRTDAESPEFIILTPNPVIPDDSEIKINPPSRSAKLRVIEKTDRK